MRARVSVRLSVGIGAVAALGAPHRRGRGGGGDGGEPIQRRDPGGGWASGATPPPRPRPARSDGPVRGALRPAAQAARGGAAGDRAGLYRPDG